MLKRTLNTTVAILALSGIALTQVPGGRGGGIPGATPAQTTALAQMISDLAAQTQALNAARTAVTTASLADPRNNGGIQTKVNDVKAAEQSLAGAREDAFAKIQTSPNKLNADQIAALENGGGVAAGRGGGGGGRGASGGAGGGGGGGGANGGRGGNGVPDLTAVQGRALIDMVTSLRTLNQTLIDARTAVATASLAQLRNDGLVKTKVDAVGAAELALANARADALGKLQASANKLDATQLAGLVSIGGAFGQGGFSQPQAMDFADHRGYVSLFDGVSLKGWDGNPKFWRVEGGAIVGESTPTNPSGNSYIAYRNVEAHDFTLKFEIKVEGDGGSGLQYRSKTGIPWRTFSTPGNAPNPPGRNLDWMQTGPQADFWPSRIFSGQFYSENTPMGIEAYRGQVVEGAGFGARRLMGTIGDLTELGKLVKQNDWNQFTIIARGGTFVHILNGQLMAVMIDDDPNSSNNWTGQFGIEIEQTTKVSVRSIWLKKFN